VLSIVWSLAFGIIFQQSTTTENRDDTIALYQQAAAALQSTAPLEAIPSLQQIVNANADSKIAPLAAMRLAECFLSNEKKTEALHVLLQWTPVVLELSEQDLARRLDPDITERATQLTKSALAQLPEGNTELLEQLIDADSPTGRLGATGKPVELGPVDGWLLAELARRYANQQRYREAYQLLVRLGPLADASQQRWRDFDVPLAILLGQPSQEIIEVLTRSIEDSTNWSISEKFSAKLAIAEAQRKLGNLDAARSSLELLGSWLDQQVPADLQTPSSEIAHWKATVDLRRAELMTKNNQYRQSIQLIDECLEKYPNYPDRALFRFLAARCLIAEIEFASASQQLRAIVAGESKRPAQLAQALWMLGEVNFLQRDYSAAIQEYSRVLQIVDQPVWHGRALLQMAKCHELQSAPLEAIAAYRTVVDKYPQSDVAQDARARLHQILPGREDLQFTSGNDNKTATPAVTKSTATTSPKIER
jgi:TolA-binding protein